VSIYLSLHFMTYGDYSLLMASNWNLGCLANNSIHDLLLIIRRLHGP
jgi:hypothetical protein